MPSSPSLPGVIRRAMPDEATCLNALTGRSARSWRSEPEFLDWEPDAITITPEFIASSPVFVLEEAVRIVGYSGLLGEPPEMALDKLFVDPDRDGLWQASLAAGGGYDTGAGATVLTLASDPNAAPFRGRWLRELVLEEGRMAIRSADGGVDVPDGVDEIPHGGTG